ncbi:NADH:flavin oxidoreductase/NADH oxidase [Adhaeribacter pallidiroseus]|uniref:Putative NADPH dehydrogenase n=1 Tax=Adhaeribacter pallidiroseus TaxID=2072847 RepID=A0A369QFZ0_9BACT|nr:NADH:flavin oxidoreductase/NADH oxidase [Adhaeribacter pallidiroseus]RDC63833.1 putative NADPH dehydrogenase [Adhaeribacter pallidiroseus]
MNHLFSPLTVKSITFKNRIVVSPMCQYSSTDGFANDWHLVHLGSRAVGGAALVIAEATAVNPEGRITPHDLGLWQDEHIPFLQRITTFIQQQGAVPGVQLAHAGRKASKSSPWTGSLHLSPTEGGWENVMAPSPVPINQETPPPQELTLEQIANVIADFKAAAARALTAGFKVIEIHGAHGYLLHEFLSPLTNQRTDAYGGSFENRTRLVLEVVQAIMEVWPADLPLFVRLSATDWVPDQNSWKLEDSVELARQLKSLGVDLIDCSSGGNVPVQQIKPGPGYQTPFAQAIRKEAAVLTGAVGLITSSLQADHIIRSEQADMVFIAREFLRDPYFGLTAASELHQPQSWPVQYERAKPR